LCLLAALWLLLCSCAAQSVPPAGEVSAALPATAPADHLVAVPTSKVPVEAPPEAPEEPTGTLSLDIDEITLWSKGMSRPAYNGTIDPTLVSFETDDETVATFQNGVIQAVGYGTTTLRASCGSQQASCIVHCTFDAGKTLVATDEPRAAAKVPQAAAKVKQAAAKLAQSAPAKGSRDPIMDPPETFEGASTFFDNAAFLGDSVSVALANRALATGELGNALFLTRVSYGLYHAVNDTMYITYQGRRMPPEDALALAGVEKVFVMLGMNDIATYGINTSIGNWGRMVERIREKCPDIEIYVQSITPVWTGGEQGRVNNTRTDQFNAQLPEFAAANGCYFIDIGAYMKDSTGGLASDYSSDHYVHLSSTGAKVWIDILKSYAGY